MDRSNSFKARKKRPDADGVIAQQVANRIVNNSTDEINNLLRSMTPPPQPVAPPPPPPALVPTPAPASLMAAMGGMQGLGAPAPQRMESAMPPIGMGMGMGMPPVDMGMGMPAMPPVLPVQSEPAMDPKMIELLRYLGLI